jgi:hypothetical protein
MLQKYRNGGQRWVINVFSYTIHAQTNCWPSCFPLALSIFFPRFPSSQLFCVRYLGATSLPRGCSDHLNTCLRRRWTGRAGASDVVWCRWPQRSPDLIKSALLLKTVLAPPLPQLLPELGKRIATAVAPTARDTVHTVRNVLDYCLNTCRVTRGARVESVWGAHKTLRDYLSTG